MSNRSGERTDVLTLANFSFTDLNATDFDFI